MRCSISEPKNDPYKHWTTSPTKAITLTLLFFIQETEPLSSYYHGVIKCWHNLQFRLLEVTLHSKYCSEITLWVLLITWSYWTLSALQWWFVKKETFWKTVVMKQVWVFQRLNSASFCFIRKEFRKEAWNLRLVHLHASSEPARLLPEPQRWVPDQTLYTWCWRISPCQYQHQSQLQSLWRIKWETCYDLLKQQLSFDHHWCGSNSKDDRSLSTLKATHTPWYTVHTKR